MQGVKNKKQNYAGRTPANYASLSLDQSVFQYRSRVTCRYS